MKRYLKAPKMLKGFASLLLLSSFCVNAVEVVSNGGTVAPQTISLQSRRSPKESPLRRRALSPSNVPLADFFLGTDLQ